MICAFFYLANQYLDFFPPKKRYAIPIITVCCNCNMPGAAFLYSTVWPVHMCILVYCLLRCPGAILGCGEREALDGLGKQGCLSLWVCTVLVSQEDHWTLNIEPKASRDITMKWRTGVLRHLHSHSKKKQCSVKPTLRESIQYIVLWREVTFWLMSGEWNVFRSHILVETLS